MTSPRRLLTFSSIRAICEDKNDDTEVRLIYANRSEEDILMRSALDRFEKQSGGQFRAHYLVDKPSAGWKGGVGFCTKQTMQDHLPAVSGGKCGSSSRSRYWICAKSLLDTKVFLCGPPGMVNASKSNLIELGFEAPGAVSKISDQVFCF